MDPVTGTLLGSVITSGLGGVSSYLGTENQNKANTAQSLLQDSYNQGMYNIQLRDSRANTVQAQNFTTGMMNNQNAFNANQAATNRAFQTGSQAESERYNTSERTSAQDFNNAQREAQNQWNLQTSSTAYQRAAADMQKAGLNRILALGSPSPSQGASPGYSSGASVSPMSGSTASSGSGGGPGAASTPSAASAAGMRFENALSPAFSSAAQGSRLIADLQNAVSTNKQIDANTQNTLADARLTASKNITEGLIQQNLPKSGKNIEAQTKQNLSSAEQLNALSALNHQQTLTEQNKTKNTILPTNALDPNLPGRVIEEALHAGQDAGKTPLAQKAFKTLNGLLDNLSISPGPTKSPSNNPWDRMPTFH